MITQQLSTPPPMVRMANGQYVPASVSSSRGLKARKLLIVVQYYEDDKNAAEELCSLIADLERVKNRDADVVLYGRNDATEPSRDIISKLQSKFDQVIFQRCRRTDARGHPWGANGMFYDMVTLFAQVSPWAQNYYAFVNLETDCVPTRPGWIGELSEEWKQADARGFSCIGFIHDNPVRHMNGVAVYAIDMWRRVGSNKLGGGDPQVPYDIRQTESILPMAVDSSLFYFEFRRPTITAHELFAEQRKAGMPAIWHGVKDSSAREAVRARHITFTEERQITRQTVLTFYQPGDNVNQTESAALLELWREGWKSRGWNPVLLTMRDAAKHGRYQDILERIGHLPHVGSLSAATNRFIRWVALARAGGGLMVDYDLIPASLTPNDLPDGSFAILDDETGNLVGLSVDREAAGKWLDAIYSYDAQPEDVSAGVPCVTDATILKASLRQIGISPENLIRASTFGVGEWKNADVIHFSQSSLDRQKPGSRRSMAVDSYLRAK